MKKATPWSLLVVFVGFAILLPGLNNALPAAGSRTSETQLAVTVMETFGGWIGVVLILVAATILSAWTFSYAGGEF